MSYLGGLLSTLQQAMWWREIDSPLVYSPPWQRPMPMGNTSCSMSISFPGQSTKGSFEVAKPQANDIVAAMLRHPEYIRPLPDGSFKYSFDHVGSTNYKLAPTFEVSYDLSQVGDGPRRSVYHLFHYPDPSARMPEFVYAESALIGRLHNMVVEITEKTKKTREEALLSRLYLDVVGQHQQDKPYQP